MSKYDAITNRDDRPVSPAQVARDKIHAALSHMATAKMVVRENDRQVAIATATNELQAALAALSTPAGPSPDQDLTADRSSGGAGDQDGPESACASSPRPDSTTAPPAAPSPREEAVEAAGVPDERDVSLVARALEGVCDSTGRPMILRERQDLARGALFAVALSAARPPSPTPEETP